MSPMNTSNHDFKDGISHLPQTQSTNIVVSVDLSWVFIGVPLIAIALMWILYYLLGQTDGLLLAVMLIGILTIIITSIAVYMECSKAMAMAIQARQTSRLSVEFVLSKITPIIWLVLCIAIWYIAFPLYIFKRSSYATSGLLLPSKLGFLYSSKWGLLLLGKAYLCIASIVLSVALIGCFLYIANEVIEVNGGSYSGRSYSGSSHRWDDDD